MTSLIPPAVRVVFRDGSRRTEEFNRENKALERWIDTGIKKKKNNLMLPFHIAEWGSSRRSQLRCRKAAGMVSLALLRLFLEPLGRCELQ